MKPLKDVLLLLTQEYKKSPELYDRNEIIYDELLQSSGIHLMKDESKVFYAMSVMVTTLQQYGYIFDCSDTYKMSIRHFYDDTLWSRVHQSELHAYLICYCTNTGLQDVDFILDHLYDTINKFWEFYMNYLLIYEDSANTGIGNSQHLFLYGGVIMIANKVGLNKFDFPLDAMAFCDGYENISDYKNSEVYDMIRDEIEYN